MEELIKNTYGPLTLAVGVRCPCRGDTFQATAVGEPSVILGQCSQCNNQLVIFDPERDGYDAEMGQDVVVDGNEPELLSCSRCHSEQFQLACGFQYSSEYDDVEEAGTEDFFEWFALIGRCSACGNLVVLHDEECA